MTPAATPSAPPAIALRWLRTVTPGLRDAALLARDGALVAGDASLAGRIPANEPDLVSLAGAALTVVARVDPRLVPGLLHADLATALAAAEARRGA